VLRQAWGAALEAFESTLGQDEARELLRTTTRPTLKLLLFLRASV
jgi:hypothetical protein